VAHEKRKPEKVSDVSHLSSFVAVFTNQKGQEKQEDVAIQEFQIPTSFEWETSEEKNPEKMLT
jgi:predicted transcriptional regulator